MLISPLNAFPWVINGLMEAWVSVRRVEAFLQLTDLDWSKYYTQNSGENVFHMNHSINTTSGYKCNKYDIDNK